MKTLSKPNHKAVRKVINKEMGKELKMRFLCESIHLIEYEQQTVSHQSTHPRNQLEEELEQNSIKC